MLRTLFHKSWRLLYGTYSLAALAALVTVAALLALLLPRLAWRRASTRQIARLWLSLAGIRLTVRGADQIPADSCVLVANHSSYLDGVVMKAALPPRFSFVIKREASSMPIMGFLLRRIGSEFVDRHTRGGRQRDAKRVVRRAEQGHSLVFFPEGTFDAVVGLKRFHIGAFVAAARGGVPLIPSVIHGARDVLPNDTVVPTPGPVAVDVLAPLTMAECGGSAEGLRDVARARMVELLDYPDLAPVQTQRGQSRTLRADEDATKAEMV
ncbi:MAG TPA: lysophospholipid acyltransferase family protein [Steroidobacteraceae bacterium]